MNGAGIYSNPDDDDYDNYRAHQSLDKKVPGSPVYQSLAKGQLNTGKPTPKSKPSVTGPPRERPKVKAEPMYNVIEQPDTERGTMPGKVNGVPEQNSDEHTQEPVYNVLEESDTEENYEAPNVGDALYNVLEEPESMQDQQPLYNVLESCDVDKSNHQGEQGSCGLSNEPVYNVVEGPDSDGPYKSGVGCDAPNGSTSMDGHDNPAYEQSLDFGPDMNGVGYDAPNGSTSSDGHDNPAYEQSLNFGPNKSGVGCAAPNGFSPPDAHDNPAYEQSLDLDAPYASVQRPGPQRESVYEPLRGSIDQDLYEPLK